MTMNSPLAPSAPFRRAARLAAVAAGLAFLAVAAVVVRAQDPSPHAALTSRPIKALSAEETEGLREGAGLGMALAAELNGYPGPMHVLELRDALGVDDDTAAAVGVVMGGMKEAGRDLGARIIAKEEALDALFAGGTATEANVRALCLEIGALRGELRWHHLRAHVAMRELLTEEQCRAYDVARGYASAP